MFQRNISNSTFNLLFKKTSYIYFTPELIQKVFGNCVIDINEIFIINNFRHTIIWVYVLNLF